MPIVIVKKGQEAKKVKPTPVTQEDRLQRYIQENPDVIPLDDLREDLRLFVIAREFPTRGGPVDALAVDDGGAVYIIETKLYKNPDKMLVVAQVLDYGAGLWSSFRDDPGIEASIDKVLGQRLGVPLREKLREVFGLDDERLASLVARFQSDLQSGRFTFVVVMDRLHDQLKDLIAFINSNSAFTLLACELEFYQDGDLEIVIPKLYGAETSKARSIPLMPGARRRWDEQTFFEDVRARLGVSVEERIRELYEYVRGISDHIAWGTGTAGSFGPKYDSISRRSVFTVFTDGVLQVNFGWLNDGEGAVQFRKKLKEMLAERAGLNFPPDYEEKYPRFRASEWVGRVTEIVRGLSELVGVHPKGTTEEPG